MKHIITIQHPQSVHHTNGMVGSWTDWDLTELGKKQADNIGRKLKKEFEGKKVVIYSSDLKRAQQTAEAIAKYLGTEPVFKQELRETSESVVASPFNGFVKTLSIPRKPLMTDYFPIPRADAMPGIVFGRFLRK